MTPYVRLWTSSHSCFAYLSCVLYIYIYYFFFNMFFVFFAAVSVSTQTKTDIRWKPVFLYSTLSCLVWVRSQCLPGTIGVRNTILYTMSPSVLCAMLWSWPAVRCLCSFSLLWTWIIIRIPTWIILSPSLCGRLDIMEQIPGKIPETMFLSFHLFLPPHCLK